MDKKKISEERLDFWNPKVNDKVTFNYALRSRIEVDQIPIYKIIMFNNQYDEEDLETTVVLQRQLINKHWQSFRDSLLNIADDNNMNIDQLGFDFKSIFFTKYARRYIEGELVKHIPVSILVPINETMTDVNDHYETFKNLESQ